MAVTIKTSYAQHEKLAENFFADVDWINEHRIELYEQYGDCVLLVYKGMVIGQGMSISEAVANAETRLDNVDGIITPVVKYLSSPYRIGVYRQKKA
jgi:hypothetical protein